MEPERSRRLRADLAVLGALWAMVMMPLAADGWSWPIVDSLAATAPTPGWPPSSPSPTSSTAA